VSDTIISFKDACFLYPKAEIYALNNINLSVREGEFLAVMGSEGAGKTTLCKLINGIIPHLSGGSLSGTVTVDGICTKSASVPELALKAGIVLDDPDAQIITSAVFNEAAFGPENVLLPEAEVRERADLALCAAGLDGYRDREPATLSGGEKQRLSIAAALAMKSKILVLDEPLCRLDPTGAADVIAVLKDINKSQGVTIIMAGHNSAVFAGCADRVCVLKDGIIAALDKPDVIFSNAALLKENGIQPLESFAKKPFCSAGNLIKKNENAAIEIKDFSFAYPNGASLQKINLSIMDNDFIAITGNNGCGKTTLLKNITGLLHPDTGDIFIRGKNTKDLKISGISEEIGFVMQNPDTQIFTDSVYKEVTFALKNKRLPKAEIKKRAEDALKTMGLNDYEAYPFVLSRSDRAKVIIACVIAMGCRILIFDEVDAGNDYNGSKNIMNIAGDFHKKGFTIIFVTHNMFLAEEYAHRIVKMERDGIYEL